MVPRHRPRPAPQSLRRCRLPCSLSLPSAVLRRRMPPTASPPALAALQAFVCFSQAEVSYASVAHVTFRSTERSVHAGGRISRSRHRGGARAGLIASTTRSSPMKSASTPSTPRGASSTSSTIATATSSLSATRRWSLWSLLTTAQTSPSPAACPTRFCSSNFPARWKSAYSLLPPASAAGLSSPASFAQVFDYARLAGFSHLLISAIETRLTAMYRKLGFRPLGPPVPEGDACFLPMVVRRRPDARQPSPRRTPPAPLAHPSAPRRTPEPASRYPCRSPPKSRPPSTSRPSPPFRRLRTAVRANPRAPVLPHGRPARRHLPRCRNRRQRCRRRQLEGHLRHRTRACPQQWRVRRTHRPPGLCGRSQLRAAQLRPLELTDGTCPISTRHSPAAPAWVWAVHLETSIRHP